VVDCDIQHDAISFVLAGILFGYLYNADHPRTKPAVARRAAASISGREGPQWGKTGSG